MINNQNGMYDNGRSFPQFYRERILDLHHEGFTQKNISDTVSKRRIRQ